MTTTVPPQPDGLAGAWGSGLIALAATAIVLVLALFTNFFKD